MNSSSDLLKEKFLSIKKLDWFFISFGLIEVFVFIFISKSFYAIIPGLLTVIPAQIALEEKKINWNYVVGSIAIVKFNPIVSLAIIAFLLGDLLGSPGSLTSITSNIYVIVGLVVSILISILALVLGILLIVKTYRYGKLKIEQLINEEIDI